ncbi:uncharacterized protein LOC125234233 [Leguminivora glycinivorella]|uniref:uncharacterized protein LOC125234233 n=1 Tax=Leguminivora glycinivorella TaxID=1035111 RepID=UPI00200E7F38|nr:uncharacterized protein LOC125234233 [Leguminivora glycinivorella]
MAPHHNIKARIEPAPRRQVTPATLSVAAPAALTFNWTEQCEDAFKNLKITITTTTTTKMDNKKIERQYIEVAMRKPSAVGPSPAQHRPPDTPHRSATAPSQHRGPSVTPQVRTAAPRRTWRHRVPHPPQRSTQTADQGKI